MQQLHILIAGASGGVGEGMVVHLLKKGHQVTALVRQESKKGGFGNGHRGRKYNQHPVKFYY
jgi:uncharacterized protein YbjT (DUF2867 family)